METHFESAPVRIGKHEWRIVVKSGWPGREPWRRLTEYQWQRALPYGTQKSLRGLPGMHRALYGPSHE